MKSDSVEQVFRALFLADLESAEPRSLDEYLTLFPGHEELVSGLYERLQESEEVTTSARPAALAAIPSAPGDRIGRFVIQRELGRGGQAIVYLASDDELHRQVAVKVLTRLGPGSESTLQRFKREAEVCSRLDVPGICTVYEADIEGGVPYIAMQFVEGDTLVRYLNSKRSTRGSQDGEDVGDDLDLDFEADEDDQADLEEGFDLPDRKEIESLLKTFEATARALDSAHRAGILHRDIKPGNIMVQPDGMPMVLDFGLARTEEETHLTLTQTGDFFGTPAYMSPEQISAHRIRLDERTDVFSLAVTLFEVLTLRRPFDSASREGIYQAILMKDPPNPRRLNPAISRDLAVVLEKALEKDRDRRYRNAGEFAEELRRVRSFEPIVARPAGPLLRLRRWTQRHPGVAAMIAILAVVIAAGSAFFVFHADQQRAATEKRQREKEDRERREFEADVINRGEELVAIVESNPFNIFLYQGALGTLAVDVLKMGEPGREYVKSLAQSEDDSRRLLATRVLGYFRDDFAIGILKDIALGDQDDSVPGLASNSLIFFEGDTAKDALQEIEKVTLNRLREKGEGFRTADIEEGAMANALAALAKLGEGEAAQRIVDRGREGLLRDSIFYQLVPFILVFRNPEHVVIADEVLTRMENGAPVVRDAVLASADFYKKLGNARGLESLERIAKEKRLTPDVKERVDKAIAELKESLTNVTPD